MSIFMVHGVGSGERRRLIRRKRVDKNWSYRYGRIASRGSSLVVTVEVLVPGVVRTASFRRRASRSFRVRVRIICNIIIYKWYWNIISSCVIIIINKILIYTIVVLHFFSVVFMRIPQIFNKIIFLFVRKPRTTITAVSTYRLLYHKL